MTDRDSKRARAVGTVRDGRIHIDGCDGVSDAGPVDRSMPLAPQVAAALAVTMLENTCGR